MSYDRTKLIEKTTSITLDTSKTIQELDTDFFFDYQLFPSKILTYKSEWGTENRKMKVGDTVLQQAFIPPIQAFSVKVLFGVRINQIFREQDKLGFSYETLEGHVEKGISIFTLENQLGGKPIFKIHTFSQPGNFLTKLAGPVFSIPYQTYCTRQCLLNVKRRLEQV
ncbi:MAG: DUF1990 family protein [Sphingobacteriales bacterium]|nr:MAG: DUF1990 family protein [Sphingobacteriales bacterium]